MNTASKARVPLPGPDQADPFRHRWRYVGVRGLGGAESLDQVALLTLEDVLYPEIGDFRAHSDPPHDDDFIYLKDVLKLPLANDPSASSKLH
jgi:hypothetical protein